MHAPHHPRQGGFSICGAQQPNPPVVPHLGLPFRCTKYRWMAISCLGWDANAMYGSDAWRIGACRCLISTLEDELADDGV